MAAEYIVKTDPPNSIIITGEGDLQPFVEHMDGSIVEGWDGTSICEIGFTSENAAKLRLYLTGKDYLIPLREKKILQILADEPGRLHDPETRWAIKLTDLKNTKLTKTFSKIKTEWDLIHYLPLRYLDRSNPQKVNELTIGEWAVIAGTVHSVEANYQHKFVKIIITDITGNRISATFFLQMWLAKTYKQGDEVVVYGNYSEFINKRNGARFPQITNPKIDKIKTVATAHSQGLGMVPIYPQKSENRTWAIKTAQEHLINNIVWIEDPVPEALIKKYNLLTRTDAYTKIHFPSNRTDVEEARRRIAFDEFIRLQVYILTMKQNQNTLQGTQKTHTNWAEQFEQSLPFQFTEAQKRVVKEIITDMQTNKAMHRLLQGDVGSGKAQPLHSKILTPTGYTTMGNIKVGDQILTPRNTIKTVIGVYPQGTRPVYEITLNHTLTVQGDQNHIWVVKENGKEKTKTTQELLQTYKTIPTRLPQISYPTKINEQPRTTYHTITNIQYIGEQPTQCILIDDPNHLYVTDNNIITHNTEISSIATLVAAENGYQTAMLAPTDILATQLYERLQSTFRKAGITENQLNIALFTGKTLGKKRTKIFEDIKNNKINVIVGTHALANKDLEFNNLGLAIIDEMHKFGTNQREALRKKNTTTNTIPDFLMMSATPIPRTIAQTKYGTLDLSIIDELPAERIPIETEWHPTPETAWDKIRQEVASGHQAYVVASLVEDSEKIENVESAIATYHDLKNNIFPNLKVGLLHGRLSKEEKDEVIQSFYKNETQILVATSVVEVGINIPNATVMTILNANRFGIASLHQIRGRVGRGAHKSYCYLIGTATMPEAEERLNALVTSNDGFWLAEKDLEIRGEGTLFDTIQSGDNDMYVGNLREHIDLLETARKNAKAASTSKLLLEEIEQLYKDKQILG